MRIDVPATNDPIRDTPALQAALTALSLPQAGASWDYSILGLNGVYAINAPLVCGGNKLKVPTIDGGHATIIWRGAMTDQPMLTMGVWNDSGSGGMSMAPCVRDLMLVPNKLARGLRIHRQTYRELCRNVLIYSARQVAVDLVDCWGSWFDGLYVRHVTGIGLRTTEFNAARGCDLRVTGTARDWPDAADSTVLQYNGRPLQTADRQRALVVHSGGNTSFTHVVMESCAAGDYPLLRLPTTTRLEDGWFEGNDAHNALIVVQGGLDVAHGRSFVARNIRVSNNEKPQHKSFVELRGRTYDVLVQDSQFRGLREAVIWASEGKHYEAKTERCGTYFNPISYDRHLKASGGAVLLATAPSEMQAETQPIPPPPP